jgi:O-antigen/teichoic acid export membrane protein
MFKPQIAGSPVITGAAWMIAFRTFSRGIGFASTLVLARILNTSDFGIVAIAFTISAALNSVSNVGVTENLIRYKTVGRPELDTGFTVQLIKGVITGALLVVAAPIAATWFSEPRLTKVIYVLAVVFALSGLENIAIINFRREMRFDREFQLSVTERLVTFAATLTAAIFLRSYWALVIGMLVGKIVRVAATYLMEPYRPQLGLHAWKELAGFSMWMWLSSLVYIVWIRADPLIVGSQVSKAVLGLYVVALDIALLPATEIMEPIGSVLFAGFAAEHNAGRDPRGNAFSLAVSLMTIMAPIALVISAASTEIVGVLLGPKWSAAAPIVAILTFSVMLSPFSNTAAQSLTASGKIRSNLAVVVCASVIKVVVLYLAARTGELYVIAVSALTITSAESSLFIYMLRRNGSSLIGMGWPTARSIASLLIAALALKATGIAWVGDQVLPVVACLWRGMTLGIVGGGAYAGALASLWLLAGRPNGPERQIMNVMTPFLNRAASLVFAR